MSTKVIVTLSTNQTKELEFSNIDEFYLYLSNYVHNNFLNKLKSYNYSVIMIGKDYNMSDDLVDHESDSYIRRVCELFYLTTGVKVCNLVISRTKYLEL